MQANKLTNVNRNNPYNNWDRGFFKTTIGDAGAARVANATWTTYGDITEPGIAEFQLELFHSIPTTVEEISAFSLGVSEQIYRVMTQAMCDNPILIEGYAAKLVKRGGFVPTQEDVEYVISTGTEMVRRNSEGAITELTTVITYNTTPTTPLTMTSVKHTFIKNGVSGELTPQPGPVTPVLTVMMNSNN